MRFRYFMSCSGIALAASTNFIAGAALACMASVTAGGAGLPSISAIEASTAQALEILERRRDEAIAEVALTNIDTAVSASTNTGDSTGAPPGSPPKKPKTQPKSSKSSSSPDQAEGTPEGYTERSSRNGAWTRGVWALGYLDHERNSDVNIGRTKANLDGGSGLSKDDVTVTKTQNGGGTLAGMDWTYFKPGPTIRGYQFGAFAGYDKSRSKFSDGKFSVFELDPENSGQYHEARFERTNARESYEGGSIGGFGALFLDRWTFDGTLKVDFANLEHQHIANDMNCFDPKAKSGDVDLTEYTIAGNASYRYDLNQSSTFSPLIGMRYTYTDFGRSTGNIDLGAENGQILRLQGGASVATTWTSAHGHVWTAAFTGLLYSDVWMDGFVGKAAFGDGNSPPAIAGFVDAASLNDEGKLRVLGQVASSVAFGNGVSMFGDVELRGGNEYFGVGGRLGGRYEW